MGTALAIGITVGVVVACAIIVVTVCCCCGGCAALAKAAGATGTSGASRADGAVGRGADDEAAYSRPNALFVQQAEDEIELARSQLTAEGLRAPLERLIFQDEDFLKKATQQEKNDYNMKVETKL